MLHEAKVREFYDVARHCYGDILGVYWHHGDPDAEAAGFSVGEACEVLEERLLRLSRLPENGRVLDFGCGVGGPTLHMADVSTATFVGVSNNNPSLETARQSARERNLDHRVSFVTLHDTQYKELPFPDETFDVVTFYDSICHIPEKAVLFAQLFRVLKPGGRIVGSDWLQRPFGQYQSDAEIARFIDPVNEHICFPWLGTVSGYKAMMAAAGFDMRVARDLFEGIHCWGSTPDSERAEWEGYSGPDWERFRDGKIALDAARAAGVFTVGMWVGIKPP
jgi:tocopherol O-methyltransferase